MIRTPGVVAAGHQITAQAAAEILAAGGNAFDAAMAALFASCVAEPVLASLGGGGFLLARTGSGAPLLYDFFSQTPRRKSPAGTTDFYPIVADFGTAQQEFHIGMGSIASPGVVKGVFEIHRDLCRLPMSEIVAPACDAARAGVAVNNLQHYISEIVSPIILSSPGALSLHASRRAPERIAQPGEHVHQTEQADSFELLAREGEDLFYQGEMGGTLIRACREQGGHLQQQDLNGYRVIRRQPLHLNYHGAYLSTNPAPSVGGTLIAFALALLEPEKLAGFRAGSYQHLLRVARAQQLAQQLRQEESVDIDLEANTSQRILGDEYLRSYREIMHKHAGFSRGTTQISIADADGNVASMTLSNGEGSGYVIPGTGIMLNNMLGEEDINPQGFHRWPENRRIASMMSPTIVSTDDGRIIATGSGGSNRIRSAILQVLVNLLDYRMQIEQAVEQPRIHYESELLNVENMADTADTAIDQLFQAYPKNRLWPHKNLFFGGAHSVMFTSDGTVYGHGDSRRGGVCISV